MVGTRFHIDSTQLPNSCRARLNTNSNRKPYHMRYSSTLARIVCSTSRGCVLVRRRRSGGCALATTSLVQRSQARDIPGTMLAPLENLSQQQKDELLGDIQGCDLQYVENVFKKSMNALKEGGGKLAPVENVATISEIRESCDAWTSTGLKLIAEGKLAILLLAGGQGSRLGSKEPKGCFNVGLPSGKSLFQIHSERILKLQELAAEKVYGKGKQVAHPLRWYIMTSPFTDADTRKHFKDHAFFGLEESQIFFFQQGFLPCLTLDGNIIVESESKIAKGPDGNGGVYRALEQSGCIVDMRKHGVECVDCFCVDNLLARAGDPAFVGQCWEQEAECGARVVKKSSESEKVGVFGIRDGSVQVVEYSELGEEDTSATDSKGDFVYQWGNICMHYFTLPFLEKAIAWVAEAGEYHVAHKKIPSIDGPVQGVKLELFIFDTFPLARKVALHEVVREEQFAPVKNAEGNDSPHSARHLLLALHTRWIEQAGGRIEDSANGDRFVGEIPSSVSYGGEGLTEFCKGATIECAELKVLDREIFQGLKG